MGQVVGHTSEWVKLLGTGLMKEAKSRLQHVLHKVTVGPIAVAICMNDGANLYNEVVWLVPYT